MANKVTYYGELWRPPAGGGSTTFRLHDSVGLMDLVLRTEDYTLTSGKWTMENKNSALFLRLGPEEWEIYEREIHLSVSGDFGYKKLILKEGGRFMCVDLFVLNGDYNVSTALLRFLDT